MDWYKCVSFIQTRAVDSVFSLAIMQFNKSNSIIYLNWIECAQISDLVCIVGGIVVLLFAWP